MGILTEKEVMDILNKSKVGKYFMLGNIEVGDSIEVKILSPIAKISQGEMDLNNVLWNREWTGFQVKGEVFGKETVISLGGENSSTLTSFLVAIMNNNLKLNEIVNTKWIVHRADRFDYKWTKIEDKTTEIIIEETLNKLERGKEYPIDDLVHFIQMTSDIPENEIRAYLSKQYKVNGNLIKI